MNILIADDTASDRVILKSYLKKMGHQVNETGNGKEALEEITQHYSSYDLTIIDVLMPVMNGHQFAQELRAFEEDDWMPLIFLSGQTGDEDLAAGIQAGGDDYLFKPINRTILAAKISAVQRSSALRRKLLESNRKLERLVNQDGLTGAANRRYLDSYLETEFLRARRNMQPLSLCMIDVDHFKNYNDSFGHQEGDECLKAVVTAVTGCIHRPADLVARYGGEEFCCVLPETPGKSAVSLAEKIRGAVESCLQQKRINGKYASVTVSIGVASLIPESTSSVNELIQTADRLLYRAKEMGRNRVFPVPDSVQPVSGKPAGREESAVIESQNSEVL